MTTVINVRVNGRYRAIVSKNDGTSPVTVEGNYDGSPNPAGDHSFHLVHGGAEPTVFTIVEQAVPEKGSTS